MRMWKLFEDVERVWKVCGKCGKCGGLVSILGVGV